MKKPARFFIAWITLLTAGAFLSDGLSARTSRTERPIVFLLDASGSMAEIFEGVPRITAARVLLGEQLQRLNSSVPVGLVAYGNRIPGCGSTRLYVPVRAGNRSSMVEQIGKMYPAGATPLANALRLIGRTHVARNPHTTVVVISDGAESCGGDPAREARRLVEMGADIRVNVIGLDVDSTTAEQLRGVAESGDGVYFDVHNHTDFDNAIRNSANPNYVPPVTPSPTTQVQQVEHDERLRILGVRSLGHDRLAIRYSFRAPGRGDYHVNLHAVTRPGSGGATRLETIHSADFRGRTFYDVLSGEAEMELEIPSTQSQGSPIYIQGELWETSDVPEHLYTSRAVPSASP